MYFVNCRIPENETPKQVGMDEGARIECFIFLNFIFDGDLVEMNGRRIYVHTALRTADTDYLNEAVCVLRVDDPIDKIITVIIFGSW